MESASSREMTGLLVRCKYRMSKIPRSTDSTAPHNTIIKENIIMADYKTFQMKLYGEEDEKLIRLAETANTDKTTFAKRRIFSDEGIIILDKSNYISRSLIELNDQFRATMRDGKLSEDKYTHFYAKLCEISSAFVAISKELTDLKSQQEGGAE